MMNIMNNIINEKLGISNQILVFPFNEHLL